MITFLHNAAPVLHALGWSLLHSLWQGAVVYGILVSIFRALPELNSKLKYAAAGTALLILSFWIANTVLSQWSAVPAPAGRITFIVSPPTMRALPGAMLQHLGTLMPWLMLCYLAGLLAMLVRLGGGLVAIQQLRKHTAPSCVAVEQMLQGLKQRLGIAGEVILRFSAAVAVPVVTGALRPMIILPATLAEELHPDSLQAILLHELAHIMRADFLINILQSVLETLLFFNPFVWRISAVMRREREHCCDDIVVMHTKEPFAYARALAVLADRSSAAAPVTAMAATGDPTLLLTRIKRIIDMKNHPARFGPGTAVAVLAALVIGTSLVCFSPSLAQQRKKGTASKTPEKEVADKPAHDEKIMIRDSGGGWHQYENVDALPPRMRADTKRTMQELQTTIGNLNALKSIEAINADSMAAGAMKDAGEALADVDLEEIRRGIDEARRAINEANLSLLESRLKQALSKSKGAVRNPLPEAERRTLAGSKPMSSAEVQAAFEKMAAGLNKERFQGAMRRGMDEARRGIEEAQQKLAGPGMSRIMDESRSGLEAAQRALRQTDAKKAMEEARERLHEARRELEVERAKLAEERRRLQEWGEALKQKN